MPDGNPFGERLSSLARYAARRRLDAVLLWGEANIRSVTGVACDSACLVVRPAAPPLIATDFRYVPMIHRVAPWLKTVRLGRGRTFAETLKAWLPANVRRLGYEGSVPASRYLSLKKAFRRAALVDVADEILSLRAVKTLPEIAKITQAVALNDEIWTLARREIRSGMTEKEIQRVIRGFMNALGDGEAFETIVCAGANAAECHHVPDDTVWRRGDPLLVDMGVKLDGVCSDMTRCIKGTDPKYREIYDIVLEANKAAIAALKPGMTGGALDKVARDIIAKAGYGKAFGHSLGHGVGYEIHEEPCARANSAAVMEPGMFVTIEPGIYLEGRLGVRIEDLALVTPDGCRVVSRSRK